MSKWRKLFELVSWIVVIGVFTAPVLLAALVGLGYLAK